MEAANSAYQRSNYAEAADLYQQLLSRNYYSEALYYNLANALYRQDRLGEAILFYERALLLDPDDPDVYHNLSLARSRIPETSGGTLSDFFLWRWWSALRNLLNTCGWMVLGQILCWMGFGSLIYWQLGDTRSKKKWGFLAGMGLLISCSLPFALGISRQSQIADNPYAIVLEEELDLYTAPDTISTRLQTLYEGMKVEML
ncbi:MAG: tetratricopeptide repeat protein, partial [Saprospiraceae bacterium]|nr:tetratricopeptide repeat protein [Saprospiraceae bacterium]